MFNTSSSARRSLFRDLGEEVRGGDEPRGRLRDAGREGSGVVLVAAPVLRPPPHARRRHRRERGRRHQPDVGVHPRLSLPDWGAPLRR